MHDDLKKLSVEDRPKMVPLLPWGAQYFRAWHSLRWYLVQLVPVTASAAALGLRKHAIGGGLILVFAGAFIAACLFVELCSGMATSNWGTHFRLTEPIPYWLQVAVVGILYLGASSFGYLL